MTFLIMHFGDMKDNTPTRVISFSDANRAYEFQRIYLEEAHLMRKEMSFSCFLTQSICILDLAKQYPIHYKNKLYGIENGDQKFKEKISGVIRMFLKCLHSFGSIKQ